METTIKANIILLPLAALFFAPWIVAPYLALIVLVSKRNKRIGQIWIDYYRIVTRIEYKLLKH